jgi:hypothetical protein
MLDQNTSTANVRGPGGAQTLARSAAVLSPSPAIRVLARLRRWELDHALADGADVAATPLLAARAAQLVSRHSRYRIAEALEHVAGTTDADRGRLRTPPGREAVRANRDEMVRLATRLRQDELLYARGIALLELILIDGTGPAYTDPHGEGLARQLQLAAAALSG